MHLDILAVELLISGPSKCKINVYIISFELFLKTLTRNNMIENSPLLWSYFLYPVSVGHFTFVFIDLHKFFGYKRLFLPFGLYCVFILGIASRKIFYIVLLLSSVFLDPCVSKLLNKSYSFLFKHFFSCFVT